MKSWLLLVAGVLVLAAVAVGLTVLKPSAPTRPTASPTAPARTVTLPAEPAGRAGISIAEPPTALRLPSGRHVLVRAVGTRDNGVLDVPGDVTSAGWWRGGARLGDPFGATLIAGHVDSVDQGLGAYAELLGVRPRQRVRLTSTHLEQVFVIASLRLIDKADVTRAGLASIAGARRLTLVTCAPPYVPARGGYQRLAVVTAVPAGGATDRRSR